MIQCMFLKYPPGSCSEGDYRGAGRSREAGEEAGTPSGGVVKVAHPGGRGRGDGRGAGEVEKSMIQLHVEEAPTVLACIGSVGTHRGRNRDESPGFGFEWMELLLAEMGKPG